MNYVHIDWEDGANFPSGLPTGWTVETGTVDRGLVSLKDDISVRAPYGVYYGFTIMGLKWAYGLAWDAIYVEAKLQFSLVGTEDGTGDPISLNLIVNNGSATIGQIDFYYSVALSSHVAYALFVDDLGVYNNMPLADGTTLVNPNQWYTFGLYLRPSTGALTFRKDGVTVCSYTGLTGTGTGMQRAPISFVQLLSYAQDASNYMVGYWGDIKASPHGWPSEIYSRSSINAPNDPGQTNGLAIASPLWP